MSVVVQKYGGTSVGSPERIINVAKRIISKKDKGHKIVSVISAMSGETNRLIKLSNEISGGKPPSKREMDVLLSTGEQTTIALISIALNSMGIKSVSLTGAQAGIITDSAHTKARISEINPKKIITLLEENDVIVIAGFQGQTHDGRITTLGRGGSDLTAIAIASALNAQMCQIFTDVDGVYTCDPRVVKNAVKLNEISYDELLEMASSGTKVMQSRSVEFAKKFSVPFEVRSSLNNNLGTIVKKENINMESVVIRGISLENDQSKVTISEVQDSPGTARKIFQTISDANIVIDMIVQNVSKTDITDISFTLHKDDEDKAKEILTPIISTLGENSKLSVEGGISKLSVVGIGMKSHSGVAAKMFSALSEYNINIQMISTSEIKITVIIDEKKIQEAANVIHKAFDLEEVNK